MFKSFFILPDVLSYIGKIKSFTVSFWTNSSWVANIQLISESPYKFVEIGEDFCQP